MSTTFRVGQGDTFESIARKKYGTGEEAERIARANPGVSEPLTAGTVVTVPALPDAPQNLQSQAPAATDDEVALLIDGQRFRFWDKVRITRSLDALDTVEFGAPFDHQAPGFRSTFRPFSFKPVVINVGGAPLFTGTMVTITPTLANDSKTISVSGYATPGVLNDCTAPASDYPLEFNGQTLRGIAEAIAAPFGLSVKFLADPGAPFERVAASPGQKALTFLVELAKQRNLVVASTERGELLFWQSTDTGRPVARLEQGKAPVLSVTPFFSPQDYYSHVTGIEPVIVGLAGSQFTVRNPRLEGVLRPFTFEAPDSLDADVPATVQAKAGRMFANVAAYGLRVATWRDPNGELWKPNTTLKLLAPDAMVYTEYEFTIRSVAFEEEADKRTATLDLIIPGTFRGILPEALPWDE